MSRRCHPSRPPIPEECEVNRLHAEVVKKRKEAAEAAAERKRKRKAKHDKACKIARAEGKPRLATPESTDEEEDASDAEAHLSGGGEAATGADSPPVYQEAGDEDAPATPHEVRPAPESLADPPFMGTERRSPTPAVGRGSPVPVVGGGSSASVAERGVALASDGRGGPRAHDADGRRRVRGECGGPRADGLEASGCSGPKDWHGQTQHECPK